MSSGTRPGSYRPRQISADLGVPHAWSTCIPKMSFASAAGGRKTAAAAEANGDGSKTAVRVAPSQFLPRRERKESKMRMLSDTAMSKRKAIPRLVRAATAGSIGLAAAGGLAAFAGPPPVAATNR
jgi:hypothetical protein